MIKFIRPKYCQQHEVVDCWHCSLSSYGQDCSCHSIDAVQRGLIKTSARAAASRENGKKGGRPINPDSARQRRINKK